MFTPVIDWLNAAPLLLLGPLLLGCMTVAAIACNEVRRRQDRNGPAEDKRSETQESYIVSAVLALLALLLGFTFSLAVDRFETRRELVLEDANAIGTAYLRSQLLGEPHRARLSQLLVAYTDNLVVLAKATPDRAAPELAKDDKLLTEIWAATAAGFDSIKGLPFSSTFVEAMNNLIDLDGARRAARQAHVPAAVFGVLFTYLIVAAGVLGYVLSARRGRLTGIFLMSLATLSLLLILDIDRPTSGNINESQAPMEHLLVSLKSQPASVYDRWRVPQTGDDSVAKK